MLTLRTMTESDVPLALDLCRAAAWNQVRRDWLHLLSLPAAGVFVAQDDGRPCGTASAVAYGCRAAWIGMVLVHPDFRRRGIGTQLMAHCIEFLKARGVRSIRLDATDQGRPVYLKLGFRDEQPIHRYAGDRPPGIEPDAAARAVAQADWPALAALDEPAFGADRGELLRLLAADGPAVAVGSGGELCGYGLAREGFEAGFLGPVVAADAATARAIVHTLLARMPPGRVFWDVLPDNAAAADLAESLGFAVARRLTRMVLGETMNCGQVRRVWAAAGFELG